VDSTYRALPHHDMDQMKKPRLQSGALDGDEIATLCFSCYFAHDIFSTGILS